MALETRAPHGSSAAQPNQWDQLVAIPIDPDVWARNLDALREVDPALAHELEHCPAPQWRAAAGIDGWPTFRLESAGQPAHWLANTPTPRLRAEAFLETAPATEHNLLLTRAGAGADLVLLLERMGQTRTVFVLEPDAAVLRAVLTLHDVSAALRSGRCLLISARQPEQHLQSILQRSPGLMPPGQLLFPVEVGDVQRAQLQTMAQTAADQSSLQRSQIIAAARQRLQNTAPARTARLAVVALSGDPLAHVAACGLRDAAAVLGWPVHVEVADSPLRVHPCAALHVVSEFEPSMLLCCGAGGAMLLEGSALPLRWHVAPPLAAPSDGPRTTHLAASPFIEQQLRAVGVPADRVRPLYWSFPARDVGADSGDADGLLILGDLPDVRPAALGIHLDTHQELWLAMLSAARAAWRSGAAPTAEELAARARAALRATTSDDQLSRDLCALFNARGARGLALLTAAELGTAAGVAVKAAGAGWDRLSEQWAVISASPPPVVTQVARSALALADTAFPRPRATLVTAGADPWTAEAALASSWGVGLLLISTSPALAQVPPDAALVQRPSALYKWMGTKALRFPAPGRPPADWSAALRELWSRGGAANAENSHLMQCEPGRAT